MMKQKITIDSVAERAGVSKTTISRYLNGRYDMLSEDTRAKIEAAIKELHYRPNRIAQSLKGGQSRLIGCIASDIGSPFTSILVKGINSDMKFFWWIVRMILKKKCGPFTIFRKAGWMESSSTLQE